MSEKINRAKFGDAAELTQCLTTSTSSNLSATRKRMVLARFDFGDANGQEQP